MSLAHTPLCHPTSQQATCVVHVQVRLNNHFAHPVVYHVSCTGLNAMANHGYIPRNGLVSFTDSIKASNEG